MRKIENERILDSAIHIAKRDGFLNITRENIANHAKVSTGKVTMAYGTMVKLKRAIMRKAIKEEILSIIADGVLTKHPCIQKCDVELRTKAVDTLLMIDKKKSLSGE